MSRDDWTQGPAKWGAVVVLGAAGLGGLGYSLATERVPWRAEVVDTRRAEGAGSNVGATAADAPAVSIEVKIDINTADAKELELLPGIGPALAERIVEHRAKFGAFKRIEDLGRVKGIGVKTIERLRDRAMVGGMDEPRTN